MVVLIVSPIAPRGEHLQKLTQNMAHEDGSRADHLCAVLVVFYEAVPSYSDSFSRINNIPKDVLAVVILKVKL